MLIKIISAVTISFVLLFVAMLPWFIGMYIGDWFKERKIKKEIKH